MYSSVKRARANTASTSDAVASIDVSKRAKELSRKISSLYNEFPEMKFILDFEKFQEDVIEAAVQKYRDAVITDKETGEDKKRRVQMYREESAPLYSLPDELFQNCLSFVGKGHYGVVGLVSKKLNKAYAEDFGKETAYLEMATSVELVNHCINDIFQSMKEKDELFKAAAVNGNVDILRYALRHGYDLFPLIEMRKVDHNEIEWDLEEILQESVGDIYYADESQENTVKLSKLVERGHLHVLKYLHEELKYRKGLQRYIKPAIQYGQLEILKWLNSIDLLDEDDSSNRVHHDFDEFGFIDCKKFYFCDCAVKSGNVEVLKWLLDQEYFDFGMSSSIMEYAICSGSLEMIKFCSEKGYALSDIENEFLIIKQRSVELYRLLHEIGFRFQGGIEKWVGKGIHIANSFDIIKYLRSISVPWGNIIMADIAIYGTLEMIKYAHDDGCPWTSHGGEYHCLLHGDDKRLRLDKFNYIRDNGCTFDFDSIYCLIEKKFVQLLLFEKELALLEFFVGKSSSFDSMLAEHLTRGNSWLEGIRYLLEHGKNVKIFQSIEEVFNDLSPDMVFLKHFHSQGLPWCVDPSRNNHLLSKIACYNDVEDVKWAYANGCRGRGLVHYYAEEWEEEGIRLRNEWKENCHFFEENNMLPHMMLPEWNRYIFLRKDLIEVDNSHLKSLIDSGLSFNSEREKEYHVDEAIEKCFEYSYGGHGENFNNRKRLALFQQMRVDLNDS